MSRCLVCDSEIPIGFFCRDECRRRFRSKIIGIINHLDDSDLFMLDKFLEEKYLSDEKYRRDQDA